ncbi:uncharacterized protein L201_004693 [Kwoniella dendrophila CBS 6074]|uniref:Uncharacterized protein n=1 Tax=Kwoniella dendrophila CBS 6074 TaxID=1295534 RepID=A0AAX4JWM0_9TREE
MHGTTTTTRTTHHTTPHGAQHTSHRQNRIRGLKAAINNPRTTHAGRDHAQHQLHSMGVKSNHPSLGTRLRHLFHLPGKSHHKNHNHRATHTTTRTTY